MKILILHRSASTAGRLPKERYEKVFSEEGFHLSWASSLDTDLEHPRDSRSGPDFLVLFDLPDEILKAKKNLRLQGVPLIFIGANSKPAAPLQDVDLLLPLLQPEELLNHLKAFQRRIEWERSRNPLSGLPGGEVIQRELKDRLKKRSGWAFYVDLNDFKAYNDCYGFQRGDSVLVFLSRLLVDIVEEQSPEGSFVGHIGGDDFFLLTSKGGGIGSHIAFEFDKRVSQFYTEKDLARGYIYSTDREGKRKRFPFMTLVLTGLSLGDSEFSTVDVLSLEMARLKKTAKSKAKALQRSIFLNGNEEGGQNWVATLEEIILQSEKPLFERRAALEALGEMDDRESFSLFLRILKESDSAMMRKSAAYGLGRLGDQKALSPLIESLNDESPHVRTRAAEALGSLGDEEAIESLTASVGDQNLYVRRALVKALGRLCRASSNCIPVQTVLPVLVRSLSDRDQGVRSESAKALGELGSSEGIPPLLGVYQTGDRLLQFSILQALGKIEEERSIPLLVRILKEEDENLRIESSNSLRLLSASPNIAKVLPVSDLLSFLQDRSPRVRRSIALTLGNIGDLTAIPGLLQLLNDENEGVQLAVIAALGNLKDRRGTRPIVILLRDPKEAIRLGAAWALGELENRKALEPLRLCLKDRSDRVRENAALAIKKILTADEDCNHKISPTLG